jgi:mRNA interferase RelE/StbE
MYTVVIVRSAQKELARLPAADYQRVLAAIETLATTPRPVGCVKLTGSEFWRIRVGQYRVVYAIKDTELIVTVVKVGNRRDVYR